MAVSQLTQANFDLDRFMGAWHEISHIPNPVERHCDNANLVFARDYTTGVVTVTYECNRGGTRRYDSVGKVRVPDPNVPSKLVMDFPWYPNYDYWVYETDYDIYAAIGNKRGYVWILSRVPLMSFCLYDSIVARMRARGFDTYQLRPDQQSLARCTSGEIAEAERRAAELKTEREAMAEALLTGRPVPPGVRAPVLAGAAPTGTVPDRVGFTRR